MPNEFGRHIFKTLTALATDFAFGLAAVRTDFFFRLDPLTDRLQHFGRRLPAGAWLGGIGLQADQHLLGGGKLSRSGKQRE